MLAKSEHLSHSIERINTGLSIEQELFTSERFFFSEGKPPVGYPRAARAQKKLTKDMLECS